MPKLSYKKHFTKAMKCSKKTSTGVKPELPCKGNKGKPKGTLPRKKIPSGMFQMYKEVPDHVLVNKPTI